MSQDSIGVVTTGTMKATGMEDNSETKPLPQIERHSYSEVGWISRQILSASGRGRTFFLTSLFIELIDRDELASRELAGLVPISLSAVSEAPTSEDLPVRCAVYGRFRYSDLKEAAPWDYGVCMWMSRF